MAGNRFELLAVEVQEAHVRLLHGFLLSLAVAMLGTVALLAFTAAIVVWLWAYSPTSILLTLAVLYSAAAAALYRRLAGMRDDPQTFAGSLDQVRKDQDCLRKALE